jgi:hypothetical protein
MKAHHWQACLSTGARSHTKNSRGWLETPDGRFFKPEPAKVQFIKGKNKPFIYTQRINKGFLLLAELFKS